MSEPVQRYGYRQAIFSGVDPIIKRPDGIYVLASVYDAERKAREAAEDTALMRQGQLEQSRNRIADLEKQLAWPRSTLVGWNQKRTSKSNWSIISNENLHPSNWIDCLRDGTKQNQNCNEK